MSLILDGIKHVTNGIESLRFAFSGALFNATRMYQQRDSGGGPQKGTYYVPQIFREVKALTLFEQKIKNLHRAEAQLSHMPNRPNVCISTQSATSMRQIPEDAIDYIFTDPPYGGTVQYGELNYLWEAWLGFDTSWLTDEIIVNPTRNIAEADWQRLIRAAMSECYRVLKPGRWLSLCYHDTSEGTWQLFRISWQR